MNILDFGLGAKGLMVAISKERWIVFEKDADGIRLLAVRPFEMSSPSCALRDSVTIDGVRFVVLGSGEPGAPLDRKSITAYSAAAALPSLAWPRGVTLSLADQRAILDALTEL